MSEIVKHESAQPMAIIMAALKDDAVNPEKLRALLDIQSDWQRQQDAKEFARAMGGFQSEVRTIEPLDKGSKANYAKMDRIWRETKPLRAKHGLWINWTECEITDDLSMCKMKGFLCHASGHSVPLAFSIPVPEEIKSSSGASVTNKAQRGGSAMSYCRRYAECSTFNLVLGKDDDGNGGASVTTATADKVREFRALLAAKGKPEKGACDYLKVDRLEDAPADKLAALHATVARAPDAPPANLM